MTDPAGRSHPAGAAAALEALVDVAVRLSAAERVARQSSEPALRAIADVAAAALHVAAASIALHDPAVDRLVFHAAADEGIVGYVFSTGQPLAIADVVADPRFERQTAERTGYVPRSLLAVPLVDGEGIIGVMEWLDRSDGLPFDLADLDLATRVAGTATATARATRLERDAGRLLVGVLSALVREADDPPSRAVDDLVAAVAGELADQEPLWRLADRIGQLRDADPDDVDLAVDWLDALIERNRRRGRTGRRARP